MKKLRISIVFVLSLIFFSKGASEENAPVFGGIENTTFANVVRNININASSTATVGYEVIGLRNHHQNATDSKFSAETLPDLEVEIVTLYPDIASERKQYMNWDRDYLINKFEKSGKNKTRFLTNLRMEYNRHPIINNSQSFQSQMEITRVPESNSTFNRQNNKYIRPIHMKSRVLDRIVSTLNQIRSRVDPPADEMLKLSWNYNYEADAWGEVRSCDFRGRQNAEGGNSSTKAFWIGWGMNITNFDPTAAILSWENERKYFDARLQFCIGGPCEFYVRLIYRSIWKVGCAWVFCDTAFAFGVTVRNAINFACSFGPGTVKLPYVPYYQGVSCSFCPPDDACEENLCINPSRENILETTPLMYPPKTMSQEAVIALFILLLLLGVTILVTAGVYVAARFSRRNRIPQSPTSSIDTKTLRSATLLHSTQFQ